MITRGDILLLGLNASVTGALIGGAMLGFGMNLVAEHINIGWLLMVPAAPCAAIIGWIHARRLARKLPQ
jgi:hypothetical protein